MVSRRDTEILHFDFEEKDEFLYQEHTQGGQLSRFNKFVTQSS